MQSVHLRIDDLLRTGTGGEPRDARSGLPQASVYSHNPSGACGITDSVIGLAYRCSGLFVITALTLAVPVIAQPSSQEPSVSRPSDRFLSVNGVLLHHLDWGGRGETILFLTGLGDSVHRFDSFAPKFIDHFRVLGLTRRGQGLSGKPASGYDTESLVEEIKAFLDAMGIERVNLIGHSIAGVEMTRFAGLYPERLAKLVYLDGAYDYARWHELAVEAKLPPPKFSNGAITAIEKAARETHPDLAKVTAPALAFFVLYASPYITPQMDDDTKRWLEAAFRVYEGAPKRETIELFRTKVKRGRIVELHDTNHFFFQDPKRVDEVVGEIRRFLSGL